MLIKHSISNQSLNSAIHPHCAIPYMYMAIWSLLLLGITTYGQQHRQGIAHPNCTTVSSDSQTKVPCNRGVLASDISFKFGNNYLCNMGNPDKLVLKIWMPSSWAVKMPPSQPELHHFIQFISMQLDLYAMCVAQHCDLGGIGPSWPIDWPACQVPVHASL